jgi:thioredoxin reductase (NADPH)
MTKPVIMTVDDEPQVLNAAERDLIRQYGRDYRIIKASSGKEALKITAQLKGRNAPFALFLVDQRMPDMAGTEFLTEAIKIYPEAKKVLLTAYADTQAAITSINTIGLDYYLLKPWDPPEQNLFPVLDDLLSDWLATVSLPFDGIRVIGTLWSPTSHSVKDFLAGNQVPYQFLDLEKDETAQSMVKGLSLEGSILPIIFFQDGNYLVAPDMQALASKIGLQTQASYPFYDVIVIGGGPAGLAAAVYAGSEGLRTVMIEKHATGGQAGTSSRIENYLGFPSGLSGSDLSRRATTQARRFGVEILVPQEVVDIHSEGSYHFVRLSDGSELSCYAMLIATGVSVRRLEVPGIDELTGAGVYYGASLSEAAFYRGREIFIVGGANSAGQAAMHFSHFASTVTMLVRSSTLAVSMSQYLIDQIAATPNIHIMYNVEVVEAIASHTQEGQRQLAAIRLRNIENGEEQILPAAALFIFIGAVPHTKILSGIIALDRSGFILTGPDLQDSKVPWPLKRDPLLLETSLPGVFAAGDARHGSIKRVASAVGEGAVSVALIHQFLRTVGRG